MTPQEKFLLECLSTCRAIPIKALIEGKDPKDVRSIIHALRVEAIGKLHKSG